MRFRRSRYHYWWQYALGVALAFLWMYLRDSGSDSLAAVCAVIAVVTILTLEVLTHLNSVHITKEGLDMHKPRAPSSFIPFSSIQDIASIDSHVAHFFRFGDVRIFTKGVAHDIPAVHEARKLVRVVKGKLHGRA